MFDPNSPESGASTQPVTREGPNVQAFFARHRPFIVLATVLVAQLLLLSFQITRNHDVRLIRVWAVALVDPFQRSLHGITDISVGAWRTYRNLLACSAGKSGTAYAACLGAIPSSSSFPNRRRNLSGCARCWSSRTSSRYQTVAAEVIASSPGENSNAIFIGKGTDAGLTPDLPVITPEGVVGKTIAVFSSLFPSPPDHRSIQRRRCAAGTDTHPRSSQRRQPKHLPDSLYYE